MGVSRSDPNVTSPPLVRRTVRWGGLSNTGTISGRQCQAQSLYSSGRVDINFFSGAGGWLPTLCEDIRRDITYLREHLLYNKGRGTPVPGASIPKSANFVNRIMHQGIVYSTQAAHDGNRTIFHKPDVKTFHAWGKNYM